MGFEDLVLLAASAGAFVAGVAATARIYRWYTGAPRWRLPTFTGSW